MFRNESNTRGLFVSLNVRRMVEGLIVASLFLLGAGGTATAATPVPPAVQSAIDTVQAKPVYQHTTFGMMVLDRDTNEVLLS